MNVYVWRKLGGGKSLLSPNDFQTWACQDIKGGNLRSIANALTNAKRAIHARIDEILYAIRIQYASDWPDMPTTDDKIKAIKRLHVPVTAIVKVLTKRRNDLEHSYLLPSLDQVRADVETAGLWLGKSKRYLRPSVVLTGLSVKSIACSMSAKKYTLKATFAEPDGKVEFYWDAKQEIVTLSKSGVTNRKKYDDFSWKDLINIQKKAYLSDDNKMEVPSKSDATNLYVAYQKWVSGKRLPSFTRSIKLK